MWLKSQNVFLVVLEAGHPRFRYSGAEFLMRALFLTYDWPRSLKSVSSESARRESTHVCTLVSLLTRDTNAGPGSTRVTSFDLNYLLKSLSPNIVTLGVGASR